MIKIFKRTFAKFNNDKGMSVVEMMVAIVLAGIIMGAVASYLTAHIRSFETTVDVIDVQFEGQLALNGIGKTAMESKGVVLVWGNTPVDPTVRDLTGASQEIVDPVAVAFEEADGDTTIFYYVPADNKIMFKVNGSNPADISDFGTDVWYDFAYNVSSWTIEPGVGGENFENSKNIYITFELEDGDVRMDLSNLFKFRNKEL